MTKVVCIIPARMGSSRFPGKPLSKIMGKELIHHVYDNCIKSALFKEVYVATPDSEIEDFCKHVGAKYIHTSNEHVRATDRCSEALSYLEKKGYIYDIFTMVQGDEPLVNAITIDKITNALIKNKDILCANGLGKITEKELQSKNCIKVLTDKYKNAIYMSRKPIPWEPILNVNVGKQICVIPFRTEFLKRYNLMEETLLERSESIDMLRIIEHGIKVKMIDVEGEFHPVDVSDDMITVEKIMRKQIKS